MDEIDFNNLNDVEITEENYESIKSYVAELEAAMDAENLMMEEDDFSELPPEVRRQRADRLADMDNTYSILNDKLLEYELEK
jgi:hypothetical protein